MRLHGKGTGREGERGLQTWDACKACVTWPNMAEFFAFTGVTRTHASLRQLKENGAKTGSDGLSAEEGGGTGGARMQNRLFADAYLDAYPKNALFWGAEGHFGGPKWGFRRKRTTGRECRMACRVSGTRETRFTPGFPGKLVPKGRNCKIWLFGKTPKMGGISALGGILWCSVPGGWV